MKKHRPDFDKIFQTLSKFSPTMEKEDVDE